MRWEIVFSHLIGQSGIGMGGDAAGGHIGKDFEMGDELGGAEGAVQANGEQRRMAHGDPEGLGCLSAQRPARGIRDGAADHDGQALAGLIKGFFCGEQGRFGVECIEDRLDEESVDAAVDQGDHLAGVGRDEVLEGHGAVAGVVDVRTDAGRPVGRTDGARHEARLVWGLGRPGVCRFPGHPGGGQHGGGGHWAAERAPGTGPGLRHSCISRPPASGH